MPSESPNKMPKDGALGSPKKEKHLLYGVLVVGFGSTQRDHSGNSRAS